LNSSFYYTGVYDKFEDLCIGRLRPHGQRARALFPMTIWNWTDVMSDFEDLLLINTSIQQWDELFRVNSNELSSIYLNI
jgi:hypothetical protein